MGNRGRPGAAGAGEGVGLGGMGPGGGRLGAIEPGGRPGGNWGGMWAGGGSIPVAPGVHGPEGNPEYPLR